jgi:acyl-homoserine lactone acylase PvdQ
VRRLAATFATFALALSAAPAAAQVEPAGTDDFGGFSNVLVAGQGETANAAEVANYLATGQAPATYTNQLAMYRDLVYAQPGLTAGQLGEYFKPAGFGVEPADVASTITPRPGVTIVRDRGFQVPHVYGTTRADAMWGAGYAQAQDRLFFMDVLRHTGRGDLSEFAGPGTDDANVDADVLQLKRADYTEAELQGMIDTAAAQSAEARETLEDFEDYVDGINAYIDEARSDPSKMPGEYAAIGKPLEDWKLTDTAAIATLIGGRFGLGGGREADVSQILAAAQERFGRRGGRKVFRDVIRRDDPEAPVTIRERFGFADPGRPDPRYSAVPDLGSIEASDLVVGGGSEASSSARTSPVLPDGLSLPERTSNAVLVAGEHTASGHPIALMGPQIGYYSPEIFMEMDLHGPDGLDIRGGMFPGLAPYVLIGRGPDFAWSATSAGTDNVDEFVSPLCEPDGSEPSRDSRHYMYKGDCRSLFTQDRTLEVTPSAANQGPPRSVELRLERTVYGPVQGRATVDGEPVVISWARSTYMHDLDSAVAFKRLNYGEVRSPKTFRSTMARIGFVFNWFYADDEDIAYFQSGWFPRRRSGTDPSLPAWGTGGFDWRAFRPGEYTSNRLPARRLPQAVNPPSGYFANWNNKQAPGWRAADNELSYSSVHRSELLSEPVGRLVRRGRVRPVDVVSMTESAATVDLRGREVYPVLRRALVGAAPNGTSNEVLELIEILDDWHRAGAHRRDLNQDNVYEHSAAVALMDAWWPRLAPAIFKPVMGKRLYEYAIAIDGLDAHPTRFDPTGEKIEGSAFGGGIYGLVDKDLRAVSGKRVRQPLSRRYCGRGSPARCSTILIRTLERAAAEVEAAMGADPAGWQVPATCEAEEGPPPCDQIDFTTAGAVGVDPIPFQNRPTFQQLVSVEGHR